MTITFIRKVEKGKEKNHTPIDPKKFSQPKVSTETHTAVLNTKHSPTLHIPFEFDKYILIAIVSILFFLSGLGFWIYVNYFMS